MATKVQTSSSWLTSLEKRELEKRGFLAKNNFNFLELFKSVLYIFSYLGIWVSIWIFPAVIIWMTLVWVDNPILTSILIIIISLVLFIIPVWNLIYSYIRSWMNFISTQWNISFWKIWKGFSQKRSKYLFFVNNMIEKFISNKWSERIISRRLVDVFKRFSFLGSLFCILWIC